MRTSVTDRRPIVGAPAFTRLPGRAARPNVAPTHLECTAEAPVVVDPRILAFEKLAPSSVAPARLARTSVAPAAWSRVPAQ